MKPRPNGPMEAVIIICMTIFMVMLYVAAVAAPWVILAIVLHLLGAF